MGAACDVTAVGAHAVRGWCISERSEVAVLRAANACQLAGGSWQVAGKGAKWAEGGRNQHLRGLTSPCQQAPLRREPESARVNHGAAERVMCYAHETCHSFNSLVDSSVLKSK